MNKSIGIDPGTNGAAVLLEDRQLSEAWWWKPRRTSGYFVQSTREKFEVGSLSELAPHFAGIVSVAIEGLFVGPSRSTIVRTSETAGELLGAIMINSGVSVTRPMASRWRADLLRLPPRTSASACDRYARQVITHLLGESIAWKSGHAVDAACIALWQSGLRGKKKA